MDRKNENIQQLKELNEKENLKRPQPPLPPVTEKLLKKIRNTQKQTLPVSISIAYLNCHKLLGYLRCSQIKEIKKSKLKMKSNENEDFEKYLRKHTLPVAPSPRRFEYPPKRSKYVASTVTSYKEHDEKESQTELKKYSNAETQTKPVHIIEDCDYTKLQEMQSYNGDISKVIALAKVKQADRHAIIDTIEIDSDQEEKSVIKDEVLNTILKYSNENKAVIARVLDIAEKVTAKNSQKNKENMKFFGNIITNVLNRSNEGNIVQDASENNSDSTIIAFQNQNVPISQLQTLEQTLALQNIIKEQLNEQRKLKQLRQKQMHSQNIPVPVVPIPMVSNEPRLSGPSIHQIQVRDHSLVSGDAGQTPSQFIQRTPVTHTQSSYVITTPIDSNLRINHTKAYTHPPTEHHKGRKRKSSFIEKIRHQEYNLKMYQLQKQQIIEQRTEKQTHQQLQVVPYGRHVVPTQYQTSPVLHQPPPTHVSQYNPPNLNYNSSPSVIGPLPYNPPCCKPPLPPKQIPSAYIQQSIPERPHQNYPKSCEKLNLQQRAWGSHLSNYPNSDWSSTMWTSHKK